MLNKLSLRLQIGIFVAVAAISVLIVAISGIYGTQHAVTALMQEHTYSLKPANILHKIDKELADTKFRLAGVLLDQLPMEGSKQQAVRAMNAVPQLWEEYVKLSSERQNATAQETELIAKGVKGLGVVNAFYKKLLQAYEKHDKSALSSLLEDDLPVVHMAFNKALEQIQPLQEKASMENYEVNHASATRHVTVAAIVGVGAVLLLSVMAWYFSRVISHAIGEVTGVAAEIANGDLTAKIVSGRRDDIGLLQASINKMASSLSALVHQVHNTSEQINAASREMAAENSDLSTRTEAQAEALGRCAQSMRQLTDVVNETTEKAGTAKASVTEAATLAATGSVMVREIVDTMSLIQESSNKINKIVSVIDSIAFQTNILALNAAVEAARAGEQGRGFSVVAAEVRTLAQRAASSAKEIKEQIESSRSRVDDGAESVGRAGTIMTEIVASIQESASFMQDIAAASESQRRDIQSMLRVIADMETSTQQNSAMVEQALAAATNLNREADNLLAHVNVFKVDPQDHEMHNATISEATPATYDDRRTGKRWSPGTTSVVDAMPIGAAGKILKSTIRKQILS